MTESEIKPTPSTPSQPIQFTNVAAVKPADPDLILFDESILPIDIMSDLILEQIGGQELINISRHDVLNGQKISYRLIANTDRLARDYGPKNFISMPGTNQEIFKNFAIRMGVHVPANGTGPSAYYVGSLGSNGCADYPVLNRYDDSLIACYSNYEEAQKAIDEELSPKRPIVYSDPENGNLVIDVTKMKNNEQVEVEILQSGNLKNDTIY